MVDNIAKHNNRNHSFVKPPTSKHKITITKADGNLHPDLGLVQKCDLKTGL
jgi:hypothetical protein